jgi:N-acetyl-anhydromuramyl-L-alanine amidase AmpD
MNIIQMLNGNCFVGRGGLRPKWLILHATAGGTSAQAIAQYFQGTQGSDNPVSAHYVIGQDGQIVQCSNEGDGAWANGVVTVGHDPWWSDSGNPNPNNVTLSIEHCKPSTDNSDVLTPAQQASSFALVKDICARNGIPMRAADASGGVTGHYSIDPVNRSRCPGVYPWQDLWNYLQGEEPTMIDITNPSVARYFKASSDDKTWTCTNGYTVGGAILDFYKAFGGSALNGLSHAGLPTSPEIGLGGGRVMQRYERLIAFYDPSRTLDQPPGLDPSIQVYVAHINSGPGQDPRVEDLTTQVTALTAQVASLQTSALAQENAALQAKISAASKDLS